MSLSDARKKVDKEFGNKEADSSKVKCPLEETGLIIIVVRKDNDDSIKGVTVKVSGKPDTTDELGIARFKPLDEGDYKIEVTLSGDLDSKYDKPVVEKDTVSVGYVTVHILYLYPLAALNVKVRSKPDQKYLQGVGIHVESSDGKVKLDKNTNPDGLADFPKLRYGEYVVSIQDLGGQRQSYENAKRTFTTSIKGDAKKEGPSESDRATIKLDPLKEGEVLFDLDPVIRIYLSLWFKDPDPAEKERAFPKDFALKLIPEVGSPIEAAVGDDGIVMKDGHKWVEMPRSVKTFTLNFTQGEEKYIVCKKTAAAEEEAEAKAAKAAETAAKAAGKSAADAAAAVSAAKTAKAAETAAEKDVMLMATDDAKTKMIDGNRAFLLPKDWTLKNSDWSVGNVAVYKKDKAKFTDLEKLETKVGEENNPGKCVLDPHWQYCRFEYFDRFYGHSDHGDKRISTLSLLLEGYADQQNNKATPASANLTTHSNWTIGSDQMNLVQCLPWILRKKDDGTELKKPDKDSTLRFVTDEDHRFIHSTAKDKREFTKLDDTHPDKHHLPCVERLAYYDLPEEWRSNCYYCRLSDAVADQDFFEMMADKETMANKPLIFSLDDMVLIDKDLKPVAWAAGTRVAVFSHHFSGSPWSTTPATTPAHPAAGPTALRAGGIPPKPQATSKRKWLSPDGLYRDWREDKKHWFSKIDVPSNYLADYPDWTRLVLTNGNLHDVFDQRTVYNNTDKTQAVGARAAVLWYTPQAQSAGQVVNAPTAAVKHPNQDHPFFAVQQFYMQHFQSRIKQMSTETNQYIGRYDIALLRCCDMVERKDGTFDELSVNLQYGKWNMNYTVDPVPQPGGGTVTGDDWSQQVTQNVPDRWNGRQDAGATRNYGAEAWFSPKDQPDLKLRVRPLMFMQILPVANAHYTITVDNTKDRAWMNGSEGKGQLRTNYYKFAPGPSQPGRFSSAHESGHMMALPDDYGELSNYASGLKLGFLHLVPGDPYNFDDEAMMNSNQFTRARNFWHMAEWCRIMNAKKYNFKIHKGNVRSKGGSTVDWDFYVPHHSTDSKSWVYWPMEHQIDGNHGDRGHYDLFLYRFGDDDTNKVVLPGMTVPFSPKKFDGILIVDVKFQCDSTDFTTAADIKKKLDWIDSSVRSYFNYKLYATGKKTIGGEEIEFKRCLIQFVPRFLANNYFADNWWSNGKNAVGYNNLVTQIAGIQPSHFTIHINKRLTLAGGTQWVSDPNGTILEFRLTTDIGLPPKFDNRTQDVQVQQDFPKKFNAMLGLAENDDPITTPTLLDHIAQGVLTNGKVNKI